VPEAVETANVLVAGALAEDLACDYAPLSKESTETLPALYTSNVSVISQSLGGVGHNVALAASYMGSSVLFCSVVADDLRGRAALAAVQKSNILSHGIQVLGPSTGARTAQYVAVNDAKKDLVLAMADMSITEMPERIFDFDGFWNPLIRRAKPKWAVVDGNWSPQVLARWIAVLRDQGVQIAFEPVSVAKSLRLFDRENAVCGSPGAVIKISNIVPSHSIDMATPNRFELPAMHAAAREAGFFDSSDWWRIIDAFGMPSAGSRDRLVSLTTRELVDEGIPQQSIQLLPFIPCILTKLGAQGVLLTQLLFPADPRLRLPDFAPYVLGRAATDDGLIGGVYIRHFPAAETISEADIASVNGAGDTLLGVIVAGLAMESKTDNWRRLEDIIPVAQRASVRTLKDKGGVSSDITGLRPLLESS
jgi:sugar/nucleoside kinase (ribokinase family)